nr:uncharacterized protein LOC109153438 [Ipomoea batatas]
MDYKNKSSMFEVGERAETPCNFSSSIYYGAQEVYSPTTSHTTHHTNYFKKEEVEDDENGNNSNCASRGDWWQEQSIDLIALNLAGIQGALGQARESLLQAKKKILSSLCKLQIPLVSINNQIFNHIPRSFRCRTV